MVPAAASLPAIWSSATAPSPATAPPAARGFIGHGGGIYAEHIDIANSIVAGNTLGDYTSGSPDVFGTIAASDGHNVFGSAVAGSIPGDVENVPAAALFAALDPFTGGGLVGPSGIVQLLNDVANPAVSAADLLAASATGQLGASRPLPAGSLPDIGSVEIGQPLSTSPSANNDVITDGSAGHTIKALAGADYVKGMGGADTLYGGAGSDLLDGGAGNDQLYGDAGIDLVYYGGSTKVTVDLSLATDKAFRGSETDTLPEVEGAIGSSGADTFKGDGRANWFQGGLGRDIFTGSGGRDLYDFNASPTASPAAPATWSRTSPTWSTRSICRHRRRRGRRRQSGVPLGRHGRAHRARGELGTSPPAATPSSAPAPTPTRRRVPDPAHWAEGPWCCRFLSLIYFGDEVHLAWSGPPEQGGRPGLCHS